MGYHPAPRIPKRALENYQTIWAFDSLPQAASSTLGSLT
jgi:hypothetical protein